jgi:hypothetical protein
MKTQVKKKIGGILLLPAVLSAGILAGPASMNIKIRRERVRFRLEPDSAAAVTQERIVRGTEFGTQRKNGDWPEVKLRSESRARLPACVHEPGTELVTEEQPRPKQTLASTSRGAEAEKRIGTLASKSLVLSLGGGPVISSTGNGVSNYMSTYNRYLHPYEALLGLTDSNTLALSLKPPAGAGFGLGLTYFLWPSLGI